MSGQQSYTLVATQLRLDDSLTSARRDISPASLTGAGATELSSVQIDVSTPKTRKELGAYYTAESVAEFLVRWAVRSHQDKVLDPSSGGGVFLAAASKRVAALGGDPADQVLGIEVDLHAVNECEANSPDSTHLTHLLSADFFSVEPDQVPEIDAVVGNPPFIRYQRFSGESRRLALRQAAKAGVPLSGLSSSWAPFLIHAIQFVKGGGRLAVVVPAELLYATYARPVRDYLGRVFRSTYVLTFGRRLFPELSEDTLLVLAEGKNEPGENFRLVDLPDVSALDRLHDPQIHLTLGSGSDLHAPDGTGQHLPNHLLSDSTRNLYRELLTSPFVARLGELAKVGIGYVSGDNSYFHLGRETIEKYGIPQAYLSPAVRTGSDLNGLTYTSNDWESGYKSGKASYLLQIPGLQPIPGSVLEYLERGVRDGVPERYKCRVRQPWYCVPHVYHGDSFLTYMCGAVPKLVVNGAAAVAPNTLLIVRLQSGLYSPSVDALSLALSWQTSLTALSCELQGHSLGGGMLKLEPREAARVGIALPKSQPGGWSGLAEEVDALLRAGKAEIARDHADKQILHDGLGLSWGDIHKLRESWQSLQARRLHR